MKKFTLLVVASFILVGSMAYASGNPVFSDRTNNRGYSIDYRDAEPILFNERGIEFMLFPNGEFDFNTKPAARPRTNGTYGAPRSGVYYGTSERGVKVEHDNYGRVRRIGNVYINYDGYGRVKRVGTVYMTYNSFALTKVGNMRITYDRRGRIINISGFVNTSNSGNYNPGGGNYSGGNGYNGNGNNGYDNSYDDNDEDLYYYRKDGTKAKMDDTDVKEIKRETVELKRSK
ncbi:hypothetical protein ACFSX9_11925 [Flavobacterium ardleyense]|uniref:Uncharacterized protein n=1 Tax=Flavobacterium ardleyense TaxID=2038737 RepID=A0ABW5ZCD7_9FLAO